MQHDWDRSAPILLIEHAPIFLQRIFATSPQCFRHKGMQNCARLHEEASLVTRAARNKQEMCHHRLSVHSWYVGSTSLNRSIYDRRFWDPNNDYQIADGGSLISSSRTLRRTGSVVSMGPSVLIAPFPCTKRSRLRANTI